MNARLRRFAVAVSALTLALPANNAHAQSSVSGRVTLLESGKKGPNDLASSIVWLVPVGFTDNRMDTIPRTASVAMRGREFLPHVRIVAVGGSVEYPNQDPFSHNVFSNTDLGRFDLGLYPRKKTRSTVVANSGVYAVYCNIHARMSNFIIAVPTRHVAQVDKTGAFILKDVPAGTYELHAWHERASEKESRIVVGAADQSVSVTLDARGFVPGPHLNKFGQTYPITRADRYE